MAKVLVELDFDLKQSRPSAGEIRRFATGQVLFLGPAAARRACGHGLGGSFCRYELRELTQLLC